jgi:uroporphyrinogen decarboxylase
MSIRVTEKHLAIAENLVRKAHANDGLAPVDLERFWADQRIAISNPFGKDIPQVPLGAICNWECVFAEMDIEQQWRRYERDAEWRLSIIKAYNDKSEAIVGRRLLDERPPGPSRPGYPGTKALHDIFEMKNVWNDESQSWWMMKGAETVDELCALLDRVDKRLENLRAFLLPPNWDAKREELMAMGIKPGLYRGQRGPVTFAMSMFGVEGIIFLIEDHPDIAKRLSDTILKAMLGMVLIFDEEAGWTPENKPKGFSFADDNCAMLNADMYEFFGYPIIKGIWDVCSPNPRDSRYQHSDSDMGHLLPILGRCDFNGVNFGPNVLVDQIRENMPNAVIHGVLAPFTFSRNDEVNIVAEFLRDFEMAKEERGLVFSTAGSINNGSRLTGMRLIMSAIQEYGRYDR